MQSLKPRCEGCGTSNALDAVFCQECGVGLNIEEISDMDIMAGSDAPYMKSLKQGSCTHRTTIQKIQCECVICLSCDKRLETCLKHVLKFDYGIQTKKKNSLDHLRDINGKFVVKDERGNFIPATKSQINAGKQAEKIKKSLDYLRIKSPKPVLKDKKLDFRSNQIPDWEFRPHIKNTFIVENDEDIAKHGRIDGRNVLKIKAKNIEEAMKQADWNNLPPIPTETMKPPFGEIIKMPDASPEQMRQFMQAYKGEMEKAAKDPNYVPLIATNKDIEIVPISPITITDVRKGIRERPKKQNPKEYITIRKNYNSKLLWLFPITIWGLFIYSLFY